MQQRSHVSGRPCWNVAALCLAAAVSTGCAMMGNAGRSPALAGSPVGMSPADQAFATMAAGSGLHQVEVARLAASRAADPQVKAYARMLADYHTTANKELMQILSARGMAAPTAVPPDREVTTRRLSGMSGADFDRQFVRRVGLNDHALDIALFDRESRDGFDVELREWAAKMLPTLRAHLQAAERLEAAVR